MHCYEYGRNIRGGGGMKQVESCCRPVSCPSLGNSPDTLPLVVSERSPRWYSQLTLPFSSANDPSQHGKLAEVMPVPYVPLCLLVSPSAHIKHYKYVNCYDEEKAHVTHRHAAHTGLNDCMLPFVQHPHHKPAAGADSHSNRAP